MTITRDNPIAAVLDETMASLRDDPKRSLGGFLQFALHSAEFQQFHRHQLTHMLEDGSMPISSKLYGAISAAFQFGFEAGKTYHINGSVEKMLKLEDELYQARMRQQDADAANVGGQA